MTPAIRVIEFVLEKAVNEPNSKRAELFRGLAELIIDERAAYRLKEMADQIDDIERRQQQFILEYKRSAH